MVSLNDEPSPSSHSDFFLSLHFSNPAASQEAGEQLIKIIGILAPWKIFLTCMCCCLLLMLKHEQISVRDNMYKQNELFLPDNYAFVGETPTVYMFLRTCQCWNSICTVDTNLIWFVKWNLVFCISKGRFAIGSYKRGSVYKTVYWFSHRTSLHKSCYHLSTSECICDFMHTC